LTVQDALFAEPRLARIYDVWEGERVDLPNYLAIVAELGARSVLDVGCGTGNWASMLAERGFEVVGLDPAEASLDVARAKPGAQRVRWIHGDVTSLPALAVDLATMTGNVSNVFLTQQEWLTTLGGVRAALRPGGYLVFESVDPAGQPWLNWDRETTYVRRESPDAGVFESWLEVTRIDGDLVSTRRTYVFAADGATLTSEGARRYAPRPVIEDSLISAGYELTDVRGAPDRPGLELVFIARKPALTALLLGRMSPIATGNGYGVPGRLGWRSPTLAGRDGLTVCQTSRAARPGAGGVARYGRPVWDDGWACFRGR
jgi:SAM-dependent methyltransferase